MCPQLQSVGSVRDDNMTPSSRGNSPRRLIKQIALDSPTCHLDDIHTTLVRTVSNEACRSEKLSPVVRDEVFRNQRQRLRKVGPFAFDSQSIPDNRSKYAGSWPPSQTVDEADDEGAHTSNAAPMTSSRPSAIVGNLR